MCLHSFDLINLQNWTWGRKEISRGVFDTRLLPVVPEGPVSLEIRVLRGLWNQPRPAL